MGQQREELALVQHFYTKDHESVDPVFFAVVPDSFMRRDSGDGTYRSVRYHAAEWSEITDTPLIGPRDPWSF